MELQVCRQETGSTVHGQLADSSRYQIATPPMERDGDRQSLLPDEHGDFPEGDCAHCQIVFH